MSRFISLFPVKTAVAATLAMAPTPSFAAVCRVSFGFLSPTSPTTDTVELNLEPGQAEVVHAINPADVVYSTSGPCVFLFYNQTVPSGRGLEIGSNLTQFIRFGRDGILNRIVGGGDTWIARSLVVSAVRDASCRLRIGHGNTTLDYYQDAREVPAADSIFQTQPLSTWNCAFSVYEGIAHDRVGYRYAHLGQNLNQKIHTGDSGVLQRHTAAGAWGLRSLKVSRLQIAEDRVCGLTVGAPPLSTPTGQLPAVRMEYVGRQFDIVPDLTWVYRLRGQSCRAVVYQGRRFNADSPNWQSREYLPGSLTDALPFRIGSIATFDQ